MFSLSERLAQFDAMPAEDNNIVPFPVSTAVPILARLAFRIVKADRGFTLEKALSRRAGDLFVAGVPRSLALKDLDEYRSALVAMVERVQAELDELPPDEREALLSKGARRNAKSTR